jgi:putative tricarboxylic transport membrane protein
MSGATLDRLVLGGFILLAVLLYGSTASYTGIAQKTSAVYVQFLAVSFGGLAAVQLLMSLRKSSPNTEPLDLFGRASRFFGLMAGLILFAVSFEHLGFFIPAAIFIPAIAWMLGYRNLFIIAMSTTAVLLGVYLIFVRLLAVNLPSPDFF